MNRAIRLAFCAAAAFTLAANLPAQSYASRASDPDQAGLQSLDQYLDGIAARFTAQRAAAVGRIDTRAAALARQAMVRGKILALIGPLPQRTPLHAEVTGETRVGSGADGFVIRKVVFQSQPGLRVTGLLYVPSGQTATGKRPAILMTPGHYPTSKTHDASAAALFAMNGFVVLSYDPIGMGERLEYPDPKNPGISLAGPPTSEHSEASLQPLLIGDTLARYFVWDAMRGIDYLSALPEVDPHRIGAFGCSGGGTVTALVAALDKRVAAAGVACYITSFDELLPTKGPQEAEQTEPRFLSSGLGFPDWIELAAPRPYAVISTYSDMFPFAGARASVIEARRFYSLFNPAAEGTPAGNAPPSIPPVPTVPAWNADTTDHIPPNAPLQFITGPGHHGALAPITGEILTFFMRNLEPGSDADHPKVPAAYLASGPDNPMDSMPAGTFQVTPTGQVSSSYPDEQTVFSLNRKLADARIAARPAVSGAQLTQAIRGITLADAQPGQAKFDAVLLAAPSGSIVLPGPGDDLHGQIAVPAARGRHAAVLLLIPDSLDADSGTARADKAKFDALARAGNVVLAITPRPSPALPPEKEPNLLGPYYQLTLRADIVGKTLLGLRVDDTIRAVDYLAARADVDPARITAQGSGHMGLVLLHAAVLDHRLAHISLDRVLASYQSLVNAPMPIDVAEDILPGVLLRYDLPDVKRALGKRLSGTDWIEGSEDHTR